MRKFTELEIAGMLQDNQDTINALKEEVEKLKNQLQRKEWMQETVDAFAEINAECEEVPKEGEGEQ
tara:strand:+ start:272 stop:469 length:198 start_codon:yes stop_codon:yes gene_type:complete